MHAYAWGLGPGAHKATTWLQTSGNESERTSEKMAARNPLHVNLPGGAAPFMHGYPMAGRYPMVSRNRRASTGIA